MSRRHLCALAGLTFFTALSLLAAPAQAGDAALRRLKVGEAGKHLPGKP